ncbi:MAG: hypothetical protein MAGBODY4_01623 [Candidatus Marinimicrobia bacterium]|nr:hypothetical protein [Candidatus Neomarinimicrobiota bacterium]
MRPKHRSIDAQNDIAPAIHYRILRECKHVVIVFIGKSPVGNIDWLRTAIYQFNPVLRVKGVIGVIINFVYQDVTSILIRFKKRLKSY